MSETRKINLYNLYMKKSRAGRSGYNKRVLAHHEIKQGARLLAKKYGITRMWLFGSYAYGNPNAQSDIDFLADYGACQGLNCIGFIEELEQYFQKAVDVVNIHSMSKMLITEINGRMELIYDELWNA